MLRSPRRTHDRKKAVTRSNRMLSALRISPICLVVSTVCAQSKDQTAAPTNSNVIDEVIVTARQFFRPTDASSATKFNIPVFETPQSISVISKDMIEVLAPQDRNDLQKFVAGAYSFTDAAGSFDLFGHGLSMRGFELDPDNGYKINGFSTLGDFRPDMIAVERVEFVKGPTAIVYGVNNYGGVINTVTKRPLGEWANKIGVGIGTDDFARVDVDSTGPLTSGGAFKYRLAAAYQDRKFAQKGSGADHVTVMPAVTWDVSDETQVNFTGFYSEENITPCNYYTLTTDSSGILVLPSKVHRDVCSYDADMTDQKVTHEQAIVDFVHRYENGTYLKGQAGWSNTKMIWTGVYLYNFFGPAAPISYVYGNSQRNDLETYDVELDFGGKFEAFGRQHEFLIAGESRELKRNIPTYQYVYYGYTSAFDPDFSGFDFSDPTALHQVDGFTKEQHQTYALNGQLLLRATDRLRILAGIRWTNVDLKFAEADLFGGTVDPGAAPFSVSVKETLHEVTPRLGLVYSIVPSLNAFASYTEGFIPQTGTTRSLGTIDPETGKQIEAGIKGEFYKGALGGSLTYYRIDRKGVQASDPNNTLDEDFVVPGREQRHQGIELEVVGQVTPQMNIVATYAHQEAEVKANLNDPSIVGNDVARVPDQLASLFVNYQFLQGPLKGFSMGGGVAYIGEYYQRSDNEFRFLLPSRWTADLNFGYTSFRKLDLRLLINNITNEDSFLIAQACRFSCFSRDEPRSARLLISYKL